MAESLQGSPPASTPEARGDSEGADGEDDEAGWTLMKKVVKEPVK